MTVPVVIMVALFVFLMLRLSPGDPAAVIAGDYATAEDIARIHEKLGLDQPIVVQFFRWVGQLASGDLGTSIFSNKPVAELISHKDRADPAVGPDHNRFFQWPSPSRWEPSPPIDRAVGSTGWSCCFSVGGFSVPVFVLGLYPNFTAFLLN